MPETQAIIFDLYGTLIEIKTDEEKDEVFDFLSMYLQYYDINIPAANLKRDFDSEKNKNIKSRHELYPEVDFEEVFEEVIKNHGGSPNSYLVKSCCKLFRIVSREKFQLFPDSLPVLDEIKKAGYTMGLVSNAQKVFTTNEIRMTGLRSYFKHMVFSTRYGIIKPDKRLFIIACAMLEVPPEKAIYVGDNPRYDVSGARETGMTTILVNRAQKNMNPEFQPDYYAGDLWDAWKWIKENRG